MLMNLLVAVQDTAQAATEVVHLSVGDGLAQLGAGIGIGLVIVGAGIGLGRIGGQTAEAMARQPEAGADIRGATLILAVLLEGATIIALVFALLFKLA
ncbi:MAG: ATP synthase F0 subunit C [Gemmatimonadales bacterium]